MPLQPMFTTTSQSPASLRPPRRSAYWSSISLAVVLTALVVAAGCCKNNPPAAHPIRGRPGQRAGRRSAATGRRAPDHQAELRLVQRASGPNTDCPTSRPASAAPRTRPRSAATATTAKATAWPTKTASRSPNRGPPAKGFWKGHCSEFDTTFGCHRTIARGARSRGSAGRGRRRRHHLRGLKPAGRARAAGAYSPPFSPALARPSPPFRLLGRRPAGTGPPCGWRRRARPVPE